MLQEEAFHLGSGRTLLREIGERAARGEGDYSIEDMQRALNLWFPRGLEMFGNEHGGETAVTFGFKDKTNGTAQAEYVQEVFEVIDRINTSIVLQRQPARSRDEARALISEIQKTGDPKHGLKPEDLLFLPDVKFFRKRGLEEHVFKAYDVRGNLITRDGKVISSEEYLNYLATVLPAAFIGSREYDKYVALMREFYAGLSAASH
jgi:hypothetical protein